MEKTAQSIAVTYQSAMKEMESLKEFAKKIDTERINIEACKMELSLHWYGTASKNYISKLDAEIQELSNIAKSLRQIASTIETVATNTYKADKKAIDLANKRNYQSGNQDSSYGGGGGGGGFRSW